MDEFIFESYFLQMVKYKIEFLKDIYSELNGIMHLWLFVQIPFWFCFKFTAKHFLCMCVLLKCCQHTHAIKINAIFIFFFFFRNFLAVIKFQLSLDFFLGLYLKKWKCYPSLLGNITIMCWNDRTYINFIYWFILPFSFQGIIQF